MLKADGGGGMRRDVKAVLQLNVRCLVFGEGLLRLFFGTEARQADLFLPTVFEHAKAHGPALSVSFIACHALTSF